MMSELSEGLRSCERLTLTTDDEKLDSADRILLLLSQQVLSPPPLLQLEQTLRVDREHNQDRIVLVFHEDAGWRFGCTEQRQASTAVQNCLTAHEALAFRPMDSDGPNRHEFPAMIAKLIEKLTV